MTGTALKAERVSEEAQGASAQSRAHATDRRATDRAPLIVHVIHRFGVGGLENGLVNLINHLPPTQFSHAIVCLTESTSFRQRIRRPDVEVYALGKRSGKDLLAYWRLFRLLRRLRPDIVHTRNLATLDCQFVAALAGVPGRVHGEHGWDVYDLHGTNRRYRIMRRMVGRIAHRFVTMSRHLEQWLVKDVGIDAQQVTQLYSGVDAGKFSPRSGGRAAMLPDNFADDGSFIIGTAGRLDPVKDPLNLVRGFAALAGGDTSARARARLVYIGDGALRAQLEAEATRLGVREACWFAGSRDDVAQLLRAFDLFVLPSLNEGISNTILEAMASGLPVVATQVGGNAELVEEGVTGSLCAPASPEALADAMRPYLADPALGTRQGAAARARVMQRFSMERMVQQYTDIYSQVFKRASGPASSSVARRS
jgi:sugar transferase (PEP-CTERM/EpsH1 system associated)